MAMKRESIVEATAARLAVLPEVAGMEFAMARSFLMTAVETSAKIVRIHCIGTSMTLPITHRLLL
jgi:hypothetical protein